MVLLCGANNTLLYTDSPTDIADCIVNIGSCLREISSNINVFICGLIPRDEGWSVNRVLIKDVNRILKYLCLKHDFSFIDQSNGWTLPNGSLDLSLFFRDSLHVIENGNIRLVKFIIILITNNLCFIKYWYSCKDTCKNKASVSFVLTLNEADFHPFSPPVHARKCKLSSFSNLALCETHGSNYVSPTSKPVENLAVINLRFSFLVTSLFTLFLDQITAVFNLMLTIVTRLIKTNLAKTNTEIINKKFKVFDM